MTCPRCGRTGKKVFRGYCSKAHKLADSKLKKLKQKYYCATCERPVMRVPSQVSKGGKVFCPRCPKNSGENHPNWKQGQYLNKAGYRLILYKGSYQLEHKVTWEQANNACILPEARGIVAVHHINMVKTDNRPENLMLLSAEEHGRIHRFIDARRFEEAKCKLLFYLKQQAFFLEHSVHLEYIQNGSLQSILNIT